MARHRVQGNPIGRHLVWGAAFSVGTFTACTLVERRRSRVRPGADSWIESSKFWEKMENERRRDPMLLELEYESFLDRLRRRFRSASDSNKFLVTITVANLAAFAIWQIPSPAVRQLMNTWFVSDPTSRRLLPHLLSGFSHRTGLHLAFNMAALWSFGSQVADAYGVEQFAFIYGSTLVLSSIASHVYAVRIGRWKPSLGASGGILGLVSMFTFLHPDRRLMLIFLPFISFPAWAGLAGIAAFDSVGLMLGWQTFDHAAHLGGVLFGYLYCAHFQKWTWNHRQLIVDAFSSRSK